MKLKKRKSKSSASNERKFMEERDFEYIGNAKDFKMPAWMDCAWRRVACGKFTCKICGKIEQDRLAHIAKGEDPDDLKNVFEDVGKSLKEALVMIKRDAEKRGIDITSIKEEDLEEPPEPEQFLLYRKLSKWHKKANRLTQGAEIQGSAWLLTEAGADLLWYQNTILAKTYRQLCTKWEMKRGTDYGDYDFIYTKRVLGECLKILKKSLRELFSSMQIKELGVLLGTLMELEKEILSI